MITRKYSLWRQLILAATVATGFGTIWFVLVIWLTTSLQQALESKNPLWRESLVVNADGVPLIQSTSLKDFSLITYRDLSGVTHEAPAATNKLVQAVTMAGEHQTHGFFSGSLDWGQRLKIFRDEARPDINWFFVHDGKPEGAGYFVGYERTTNRLIGYIGLKGYRSDPVEPIDSPGIPLLSSWSGGYSVKEQPILVRTSNRLYVLDHQHKVTRTYLIPTEADRRNPVTWYEIGNGEAIAEFIRPRLPGEPEDVSTTMLYPIASDGTIREGRELRLKTGAVPTNQAVLQMQVFLGLPSPAFLFLIEPLVMSGSDRTYAAAFRSMLGSLWPSLLAVVVLAIILAIVTWRRSRSFGFTKSEQAAWSVFVLFVGFPAFIGFLLGRRWPIRLPCPACHARVPRDRSACAECGALFPEPSLFGIEIFA